MSLVSADKENYQKVSIFKPHAVYAMYHREREMKMELLFLSLKGVIHA